MRRALVLFALGSAIVGCGGHSGLGVGAQTTLVSQVQQNWNRTYDLVGFFTPNAGSPTICHGTLIDLCTSRVGTQITTSHTWALTVAGVTSTFVVVDVANQALDGSISLLSTTVDSNPTLTVQTTNFAVPGTWGLTTTAAGTTTFTDSSVATDSLTVIGATQIHTPAGAFDTWTTAYHHTLNSSPDMDLTEYVQPAYAGYVYASGTVVFSTGSFQGTIILRETNIPSP